MPKKSITATFKSLFNPEDEEEEQSIDTFEKQIRQDIKQKSQANNNISLGDEKAELKKEYASGLEEAIKERKTAKKVEAQPSMSNSEITANQSNTVKVLKPTKKDDAYIIINHLKNKQVIFVMLNEVELNVAREIFDIISGALYFAGYKVESIADNQYLIDPNFT